MLLLRLLLFGGTDPAKSSLMAGVASRSAGAALGFAFALLGFGGAALGLGGAALGFARATITVGSAAPSSLDFDRVGFPSEGAAGTSSCFISFFALLLRDLAGVSFGCAGSDVARAGAGGCAGTDVARAGSEGFEGALGAGTG